MADQPQATGPSWQVVTFVSMIAAIVGAIAVTAIIEYSADDALKIWAGLSGLVGILIGAGATYFPAAAATQQAQGVVQQSQATMQQAIATAQQTQAENQFWTRAAARMAGEIETARWTEVVQDIPELKSVRPS